MVVTIQPSKLHQAASGHDHTAKQKRGGVGVGSGGVRRTRKILWSILFIASTHDNLLLFTSRGRPFAIKVTRNPPGKPAWPKGKFIAKFYFARAGPKK